MTIFDSIKYPFSDQTLIDEWNSYPVDIHAEWNRIYDTTDALHSAKSREYTSEQFEIEWDKAYSELRNYILMRDIE